MWILVDRTSEVWLIGTFLVPCSLALACCYSSSAVILLSLYKRQQEESSFLDLPSPGS